MRTSIGRKLTLSYLLVALLVAVVGFVGFSNMSDTASHVDVITKREVPSLFSLLEMKSSVLEGIDGAYAHLLSNDSGDSSEIYARLIQFDASFNESAVALTKSGNIGQRGEEEKTELFNEILAAKEALTVAGVTMFESYEKVGTVDLSHLDAFEEKIHILVPLIDTFLKIERAEVADANRNINTTMANAQRLIIVVVTLAILLAIGLGLLVSHSITAPINKLKYAASRVGRGELDAVIDIKSKDEIGDLGLSFSKMTLGLREQTAALEQSRQKLQTIYDHVHEGVIWLDFEERITQANPAVLDILGYSLEEFNNFSIRDIVSTDDRDAMLVQRERTLDGETPVPLECEWRKKDGSLVAVQVWSTTICDRNGIHYATIVGVNDLTKQEEARMQLIQAEKLAVIGQMVSGVAHELNNPLAGIWGLAALLKDRNLGDDVDSQIAAIHREAGRSIRIVQNLLEFARPGLGVCIASDINAMVRSTMELKSYELRAQNIEVKTYFEENLPQLDIDPHEFQQVILNLLTNAQQAILNSEGSKTISISTSLHSDLLYIVVSDDGPGVDPKILGKIFEPFFTTKEVGKGTGLGLSICFTTVENMGGSITAKNQPTGGASFTIKLPVGIARNETTTTVSSGRQ